MSSDRLAAFLCDPARGSSRVRLNPKSGRTRSPLWRKISYRHLHWSTTLHAALGVSSSRRSAALPDVPTIAEQGVAGFSMTLWFGMWAPAGTPAPVIQKLNGEVGRILQMAEVREQYGTLGVKPIAMQTSEFAKFVRDEIGTYQRIVKEANIQQQ